MMNGLSAIARRWILAATSAVNTRYNMGRISKDDFLLACAELGRMTKEAGG
jgi:hypothetical protein